MPVLPAVASTIVPPGLRRPLFFGAQNDSAGGPVFDAAAGIQIFQFGEDVAASAVASFLSCRMGVSPTSVEMSSVTRKRELSVDFVVTLQGTEAAAERQLWSEFVGGGLCARLS